MKCFSKTANNTMNLIKKNIFVARATYICS
jgi:hypothetical protein